MTVSFLVAARQLPPFNAIVGASGTIDPVQLAGAGWTGDPWPKGLFAKIVDASSAPTKMELTPELDAQFARAGIHGSFIAFTRGAARGVVVGRSHEGLSVHVPMLASAADYLLAAGLAAGAAKLVDGTVTIVDPGAPEGAGKGLGPDAVLAQWTATSADAHARQFGSWLADDIVQGRTYFFHGPRGIVALAPGDFDKVAAARASIARGRSSSAKTRSSSLHVLRSLRRRTAGARPCSSPRRWCSPPAPTACSPTKRRGSSKRTSRR